MDERGATSKFECLACRLKLLKVPHADARNASHKFLIPPLQG
jgi:hypothetical protein